MSSEVYSNFNLSKTLYLVRNLKLKKLFKIRSVFIKNFLNLSANQGFNIISTLIYTPLLFQSLGDKSFGLVQFSFSILIILSIFISFGYNINGPVIISKEKNFQEIEKFTSNVLLLRIFLSLMVIGLSFPIIFFFVEQKLFKILIFSFTILFSEALNPLFYLQGKNQIFPFSLLNFFSKSLYILLIVLFISDNFDAFLANFFYGISLTFFYISFWIHKFLKSKLSSINLSFDLFTKKIKNNFQLFLSSVTGHLSINSALIILFFFVNDIELGRFALAYKIAFMLRMIPTFFIQSSLQHASKLYIISKENFITYLNKYFYGGIILLFLIGILFISLSSHIIEFFANEKIYYSTNILIILSFIPLLAMLNYKNMIIILVRDMKAILNKASYLTFVFMFFLSIFLSKLFGGIGLAYALLINELFSFLIHYYLINKNDK
jgi:PST family polysaccharide transporter